MSDSAKMKITNFKDRFGEVAEIDTFESFFLTMDHNGSVGIKGCVQVREYTEDQLILVCKKFIIEISGAGLYIHTFAECETVISGTVTDIHFLRREQNNV